MKGIDKPDDWTVLLEMLQNNPVPYDFLNAEDRQQGVAFVQDVQLVEWSTGVDAIEGAERRHSA